MKEFIKTNVEIIKDFFSHRVAISILLLVLVGLSVFVTIYIENPALSRGSVFINSGIIGLLYGIGVAKSTKLAGTVYEQLKETNQKEIEAHAEDAKKGIMAKDVFWYSFAGMTLFFFLNLTSPINTIVPMRVTYFLVDIAFFLCIIYGIQAEKYLRVFMSNVGIDILEKSLKKGDGNE